ncbi:MAG: acyl carrier protein [Ramlibacter sp.]|nr:acyl carrier protein [Ramlibacter sp.]
MQALEQEIKDLIISALSLEDVRPQDIATDAPLFVEGLGLDSIDALELGVALQKRYGVTMSADAAETRQHFGSVAALARFVAAARTDAAVPATPANHR